MIRSLRSFTAGSRRSALYVLLFALTASYVSYQAEASSNGYVQRTLKNSKIGCDCHGSRKTATIVTISASDSIVEPGAKLTITVTVKNPAEEGAGFDAAAKRGTLTAGEGSKKLGADITHSNPQSFDASSTATWTFTYTAPSTEGVDSIYANGNAVNLTGGDGGDAWNWATTIGFKVQKPVSNDPTIAVASTVDFGVNAVSSSKEKAIQIRNTGAAPLTIFGYKLTTTGEFIVADTSAHTIAPGSTDSIAIEFAPSAASTFTGSIVIASNDPAHASTTVNLTGKAEAAQYKLNKPTLDFGSVMIGELKDLDVTFTNTGNVPLTIVTLTGPSTSVFSVVKTVPLVALPYQLKAKDSIITTLRFIATTEGSFDEDYGFELSDGTTGTLHMKASAVPANSVSRNAQSMSVTLSPNPARTTATISFASDRQVTGASVEIVDAAGRVVSTVAHSVVAGENTLPMSVAALPAGAYSVVVLSSNSIVARTSMIVTH